MTGFFNWAWAFFRKGGTKPLPGNAHMFKDIRWRAKNRDNTHVFHAEMRGTVVIWTNKDGHTIHMDALRFRDLYEPIC